MNIVGRLKDMIIRGGENIYPREIEEFLHTHPKSQRSSGDRRARREIRRRSLRLDSLARGTFVHARRNPRILPRSDRDLQDSADMCTSPASFR